MKSMHGKYKDNTIIVNYQTQTVLSFFVLFIRHYFYVAHFDYESISNALFSPLTLTHGYTKIRKFLTVSYSESQYLYGKAINTAD